MKKSKLKKSMSLILCVIMLFPILSMTAFADTGEVITNNKQTEATEDTKDAEPEAKTDNASLVDTTFTVITNDFGHASIYKTGSDEELVNIGSSDKAVLNVKIGELYTIRTFGDNPEATLSGASVLEKNTINNGDKITIYNVQVTDLNATATFTFEGKTNLLKKFTRIFRSAPATSGYVTGHGNLYNQSGNAGTGKFWANASDGKAGLYGVCCERYVTMPFKDGNSVSLRFYDPLKTAGYKTQENF